MAKKQISKRSVHSRKVRKQEGVPQPIQVAVAEPEFPTADTSVVEERSAPPSRWRDRLLIFALTLAGTLAGVWIGTRLPATQSNSQSGQVQASDAQTAGEQKQTREILMGIQEELVENARILKQRRSSGDVDTKSAGSSFLILRDDFWTALVHNSEMHWVTDVQLLRTITKAYYFIHEIEALEQKSAADKNRQKYLPDLSALAEKSIVDAAVAIDQRLVATYGK